MIAKTHAIYGPAVALILLGTLGVQESFHWSVVACAILGAIAPDIDYPASTLGKLLPQISKPIEQKYGHRSVTHSFVGTGIASVGFALIIGSAIWLIRYAFLHVGWFSNSAIGTHYGLWFQNLTILTPIRLSLAFGIGYVSHLILDMLTPRGVQLLWPNPNRDVIFKDSFKIETGSKAEIPIAILGILLLVLAFPLSEYGPTVALRWLLATPESAIQQFSKSHTATFVEFSGTWTATKAPVSGTAEVLDVDNKRLVVLFLSGKNRQPQVVTLSDKLTADITTTKVQICTAPRSGAAFPSPYEGEGSGVRSKPANRTLEFSAKTRAELLSQITDTDLISGIITLPADVHVVIPNSERVFQPIRLRQGSGGQAGQLELRFATKAQLAHLKLDDAWQFKKKEDQMKLQQLLLTEKKLLSEMAKATAFNDGLTPLGRQFFRNTEDTQKRQAKVEQWQVQLEKTRLEIEKTRMALKQKELVFSGKVRVRSLSIPHKENHK